MWNGKIKIQKHIHFDTRLTSCLPVKCPSQLTKHPEPAPPVAQRVSALFLPLYHCSVRWMSVSWWDTITGTVNFLVFLIVTAVFEMLFVLYESVSLPFVFFRNEVFLLWLSQTVVFVVVFFIYVIRNNSLPGVGFITAWRITDSSLWYYVILMQPFNLEIT